MGNSMAKQQAAGQARMMERQMELQQEMRARMMAAQIAGTRDMLNFMGAFGVVAAAGLARAAQRSGNPAFLGPLVPFSFVLAYQADFAYGDKVGRITRNAEEILAKERNLLALPGGALTPRTRRRAGCTRRQRGGAVTRRVLIVDQLRRRQLEAPLVGQRH